MDVPGPARHLILGFFTFTVSFLATIVIEAALLLSGQSGIPVSSPLVFSAFFIYGLAVCLLYLQVLGRLRISGAGKPTAKALQLWLPSFVFFILGIVAVQAVYSGGLDSCRQACEGSPMCEAHCSGMNYVPGVLLFLLETAAAAGPCNPFTMLIACHILARMKKPQPTSL
jgi:hypothetical protein